MPRRFGKTISVSMFAAAMLAAPNVELSIYSICKRISQKLLRNVIKLRNVVDDLEAKGFKAAGRTWRRLSCADPKACATTASTPTRQR